MAAAAAATAARRVRLVEQAEFDSDTRFPVNAEAKMLLALDWTSPLQLQGAGVGVRGSAAGGRVRLPLAELELAARGWDASSKLGGGATCSVYRGVVYGVLVAIKRLEEEAGEWADRQFTAEMELLSSEGFGHPNLCRLLASSGDGPARCLVLELCEGGSLQDRLAGVAPAGVPRPPPLQWQQRVQIALQILLALDYLHSRTPQIIHR
jgi:serine/threonine protein kinase